MHVECDPHDIGVECESHLVLQQELDFKQLLVRVHPNGQSLLVVQLALLSVSFLQVMAHLAFIIARAFVFYIKVTALIASDSLSSRGGSWRETSPSNLKVVIRSAVVGLRLAQLSVACWCHCFLHEHSSEVLLVDL